MRGAGGLNVMQTIYAFEIPVGVCWVFAAHHRDLCWRWESGILSNLLNADKKKKKKKERGEIIQRAAGRTVGKNKTE